MASSKKATAPAKQGLSNSHDIAWRLLISLRGQLQTNPGANATALLGLVRRCDQLLSDIKALDSTMRQEVSNTAARKDIAPSQSGAKPDTHKNP